MKWFFGFIATFLLVFLVAGNLLGVRFTQEFGYVIDRNEVRFAGSPLEDADPETFEWLEDNGERMPWGRDKNYGYYRNIRVPNSHGPSFQAFSQFGSIAKDKNRVYVGGYRIDSDPWFTSEYERWKRNMRKLARGVRVVKEADAGSFRHFKHNWFVDDFHLFVGKTMKKDIDPNTFKPFKEGKTSTLDLWVDANHVYEGTRLFEHADPKSFRIDEATGDAMDDRYVYDNGHRYEGEIDGEVVPAKSATWRQIGEFHRTDGNLVFGWIGKAIPDADPKTFLPLTKGFAKDAKRVYYKGKAVVADVDAASFVVDENGDASDINGPLGLRDPRKRR